MRLKFFLRSFITPENKIAGFLRLSLPKSEAPQIGIADLENAAIIREVHVYGQALSIGEKAKTLGQHSGLGKQLMKKAEEIVKEKGISKLKVISGIGAREYYRKLRYRLDKEKIYMEKN